MKISTWNVAGLRAAIKKGFFDYLEETTPDILCLQEVKIKESQITFRVPDGYKMYLNSASKAGYSGTAIFTRQEPLQIISSVEGEGRFIIAEYDDWFLITSYTPNAQNGLSRIDYRLTYDNDLQNICQKLMQNKSVILCGDLNVAHNPIDLSNPSRNEGNAGFSIPERKSFEKFLDLGMYDVFRDIYPSKRQYTFWPYISNARKYNAGWRLDYFLVSSDLRPQISDIKVRDDIFGSDHCPVELIIGR